jgi:hypothetical protein
MKALRFSAIIFISLIAWWLTFSLVHHKVREIVRYIANNITKSNAGPYCCKFEWDFNLQVFMYSLYVLIFLLTTSSLIVVWKKYKGAAIVKRILVVMFIMIFPTHTFWGVASNCGGFGGCSNGYHFNMVVPIIMSTNPIAIIISALVAYKLATIYISRNA